MKTLLLLLKPHWNATNLGLVFLYCLCASPLFGQTVTGKISGKVVDTQSRNPLPGVNIVIVGTTMGAATDSDGDYFIINIPPGTYDLQASMIGYATQIQEDVMVQVERTVVMDFKLGTQALQGEEVTISAEREIIKMDISGSTTHIAAEEFTTAPVTTVVDYLQIQEGVEFASTSQGKFLSIRGGGRDETDFYIDGMSTMNAHTASAYMSVSRTAIKEVSIQTGGFNAEYGRVRSGLVNVVTRDGSREEYSIGLESKYSFPHLKHFGRNLYDNRNPYYITRIGQNNFIPEGSTEPTNYGLNGEIVLDSNSPEYRGWAVVRDDAGNFSHYVDQAEERYTDADVEKYGMTQWVYNEDLQFDGWKGESDQLATTPALDDDLNPADLVGLWMIEHQPLFYGHRPDYDLDVSVTGPLPGEGLNNKLGELLRTSTFMASYRTQTSQFVYPGNRRDFKDRYLQAKITSRLGTQTKLRLNALYGEAESLNAATGLNPGFGGFYYNDGTLGAQETVTGDRGGGRLSGDLGHKFSSLFGGGGAELNNSYQFQASAKLTHTVSPSTYFEMEFQYQENTNNFNPGWTTDWIKNEFWIYNKDGLVNERGEPRTFITDDPQDIFPEGVAQRLDPVLRSQILEDITGLAGVPSQNLNARNRPFSQGGSGTWVYSDELLATWFDDSEQKAALKGSDRLAVARGETPWVDPATLPGSYDRGSIYNSKLEPNVSLPRNGGLVYGATLPGITLVDGLRRPEGVRVLGHPDFLNEYFILAGGPNINRSQIRRTGGRMTLVSQITKHNQIKAGVDFQFYRYKNMHSTEWGDPFGKVEFGEYNRQWNQLDDNPFEVSLYIQDKIEVEGLIANLGLRADLFDPTVQGVDFVNNPFHPDFRLSELDQTAPQHFVDADRVKAKVQVKFSPRLGLSFPVTETSKVYFNYGWFYQRPTFAQIFHYRNLQNLEGTSPANAPNVNADWPRTIQMEMGYEQNIKGWFLLHAAGFFKDSDDLLSRFEWENYAGDGRIWTMTSRDFSDVRGLEFRFDKNYGLWRSRVNYTYLIRSRGRAGASKQFEDPVKEFAERENTIRSLSETRWQPTPTLRGTMGLFTPRRWGPRVGEKVHPFDKIIVNMIFRWYDRGERRHEVGVTPDLDIYVDNVNHSNTDLRAEKRIGIGRRVQLGLFIQVYNLWNQKFLVGPNGNKGIGADASEYEENFRYTDKNGSSDPPGNDKWGEFKPEHLRETLPWWKDNIMFSDKRDVFYGISFTFN